MTELARAEIVIGGDNSRLMAALGGAEKRMKVAGRRMQAIGSTLTASVTLPLVAMGAASVKAFADFDQAMTESLAIMGDVSDSMRTQMVGAAREVGRSTTASATEAAEAYFFLASAGLDAQQSVAALPQVARFAQAGMFDMSTATDLATDAQSALGLTVDDAAQNLENLTRVTDVLVNANQDANASVQQFSEALTNRAAAALKAANKDLEEGVAVLAAFADQGVKGLRAGEALARIMRLLSTNAAKNTEEFRRLGLIDAEGNLANLADVVEVLSRELGGLSDTQQAARLEMLGFTARVQAVIKPLLGTSDAIRRYQASAEAAGESTREVSDNQLESFKNQMILVKDNVVIAAQVIGEVLAPFVLRLAQRLARGAQAVANMDKAMLGMGLRIAGVAAAIGPLFIVAGKVVSAVGGIAGVFGSIVSFVNPLTLGLAAIALALRQQVGSWSELGQIALDAFDAIFGAVQEFGPSVFNAMKPALNFAIGAFISLGAVAVESGRVAIEGFKQLWDFIVTGAAESGNFFVRTFAKVTEEISRFANIMAFEIGSALGTLQESEDEALVAMGNIGQRMADAAVSGFGPDYVGGIVGFVGRGIDAARQRLNQFRQALSAGGGAAGGEEGGAPSGFTVDTSGIEAAGMQATSTFERMKVTGQDAAETISSSFASSFGAVITGSQNALGAFVSFAKGVISQLIAMIAKAVIFNAIMGFITGGTSVFSGQVVGGVVGGPGALVPGLPGLQHGGIAQRGRPFLVGEAGPELFVPQSAGRVMSNRQTRDAASSNSAGAVAGEILSRVGPPPGNAPPSTVARDAWWREVFANLRRDDFERRG